MREDILNSKELILKLISKNEPKSEICRILKCRPHTLERYLKFFDIKYKGNMGKKNLPHIKSKKPLDDYLSNKINISSHRLKIRLIEDGIKNHQCEKCKLTKWLDDIIPIELHHIDGNRFNNNLNNLEILCPNCHSKTTNNSGKSLKDWKKRHCKCGKIKNKKSITCKSCVPKKRKIIRPEYELLLKEIKEFGFSCTGRKYNVSDNSIRKWIKNYEKAEMAER